MTTCRKEMLQNYFIFVKFPSQKLVSALTFRYGSLADKTRQLRKPPLSGIFTMTLYTLAVNRRKAARPASVSL